MIETIIFGALIVEAVVETAKMIYQEGKLQKDRLVAMVFGIVVAIGFGFDLMATMGIESVVPYLGMVLTGILISRGANFMHDILATAGNIRNNSK